ncbi:MAG: GTPase KRas precursor [Candidatus Heimdallarchaeota archaeon LC_3]|nr:MAG: GTPase KRas precursor [Candidatus Heimdallarchaeota archaeon LC_3]
MMEEHLFKIAMVGEPGVGKTTAIARFVNGRFNSDTKSTLGVDFSLKHVSIKLDETDYKTTLQIWDIAGEHRYRDLMAIFISGTKGLLLVFDNMNSLESLQEWLEVLDSHIPIKEIPKILISTKDDLNPTLDDNTIRIFISDYNVSKYFTTSSVTGKNIEEMFERISQLAMIPSLLA